MKFNIVGSLHCAGLVALDIDTFAAVGLDTVGGVAAAGDVRGVDSFPRSGAAVVDNLVWVPFDAEGYTGPGTLMQVPT